MSKSVFWLRRILTIIVVITFCVLMIRYAYIASNCFATESDHAWNATISKNFAATGEYATIQPKGGLFFETISTGVPVLLLQAFVFKVFGISHFTSFLTVLIFALALFVLSVIFIGKKTKLYLLCSLLLSLFLYFDGNFAYLIPKLYGEIPVIFFSMYAFYLLYAIFDTNLKDENKKIRICFIAGLFFGLALITKLIMIFLILSFLGIVIIDIIIYKNFTLKTFFSIIIGILTILLIEFLFRFVQFNFSFAKSFKSIIDFINNMYGQTKWSEFRVMDNSTIFERIEKFPEILNFSFLPIIYVSLPAFIGLITLVFKRKENLLMIYVGVCTSSIFIYYILFGTLALHFKRLFPYTFFLLCYYIYVFLLIVKMIFSNQKLKLAFKILILFAIVFLCSIISVNFHKRTIMSICGTFFVTQKDKERYREDEYIEILNQIPIDAKVFTINQNTSIMCLYTNIKQSYDINSSKIDNIVKNLSENEKVYLVCHLLDQQIEPGKNNIDVLKSNGMLLNKLNKIKCYQDYDNYGIYEIKFQNKESFIDWHKNYCKNHN